MTRNQYNYLKPISEELAVLLYFNSVIEVYIVLERDWNSGRAGESLIENLDDLNEALKNHYELAIFKDDLKDRAEYLKGKYLVNFKK